LRRRVSASKKTRLRDLPIIEAISLAASTLLKSKKAGDEVIASPRRRAALASPTALIMVDLLS
jgi:hypothetical protein